MGKEREEETFVADAANLGKRRRRRRKGLCSRLGSLPLKRRAAKNPKVKFSNCLDGFSVFGLRMLGGNLAIRKE